MMAPLTESGGELPVSHQQSLWHNRDYLLLWGGQAVSTVGTGMSRLAFPLLVLAITGSAAVTGLAGAAEALPYIFLSLPAGALVDRWDRKRVMLLCDTGRALAMASIPISLAFHRLTIAQIFVVALMEGTLYVFFNLAQVACLPRVVPIEQLPTATAQNMATDGIADLLSPSLGGALFAASQMLPFLGDAISYGASVLSLLLIRTKFQGERSRTRRSLGHAILEGMRWMWRQPLIRSVALLTGGLNFLTVGTVLIVIVLVRQQHAPVWVTGVILSIGGIGGVVGAILGPIVQRNVRFGRVIIGSVWAYVLLYPLLAVAPDSFALGLVLLCTFIIGPIYDTTQYSYRLALIPDALQGRVNSVFRLLAFGLQPLGLALAGVLIQTVHVVPTVLLGSVVMLALAVSTSLNRHIRNPRPLAEARAALNLE